MKIPRTSRSIVFFLISLLIVQAVPMPGVGDDQGELVGPVTRFTTTVSTLPKYHAGDLVKINYTHGYGHRRIDVLVQDPSENTVFFRSASLGEDPYGADGSTLGLWHFNETTGSNVNDSSIYSNHGTITGATRQDADFERSLLFSGSDRVEVPDSANLDVSYFTVEAWVKPTSTGTYRHCIVDKEESYEIFFDVNMEVVVAVMTQSTTWYAIKTGVILPLNQWSYLAVTYDGVVVNTYMNGALQDTVGYTNGAVKPSEHPFLVGCAKKWYSGWEYDWFFPGEIDEVRLSNRARSAQEISDAYSKGAPGYEEVHYRLPIDAPLGVYKVYSSYHYTSGLIPVAEFEVIPVAYPPSPPRNFKGVVGDSFINLSWSEPIQDGGRPITGYKLFRGIGSDDTAAFMDIDRNLTFYNDTEVENGIMYYYELAAENMIGLSERTEVTPLKPVTIPDPPRSLRASSGDGYVRLDWEPGIENGGSPGLYYNVYRSNSTLTSRVIGSLSMTGPSSYNDTTVRNGDTYHYFITSVTNVGESPPSEEIRADPLGRPSRPTALEVSSGYSFVHMSWTLPVDDGGAPIEKLTIYRKTAEEDYEELKSLAFPSDHHNDTTVTNGVSYQYYLTASNIVGESPASNVVSVLPRSVPFAPGDLTASKGDRFVHITWTPPSDNGGDPVAVYHVYRRAETEDDLKRVSDLAPFRNDFNDTDVENGIRYFYQVFCFNDVGRSPGSEIIEAVPMTVPWAPTEMTLTPGNAFVNIRWKLPTNNGGANLTSLVLFRGLSMDLLAELVVLEPDATEYNDTGLENGEEYFYSLKAGNQMGRSKLSLVSSAVPKTVPGRILNLISIPGDGFVLLMWGQPLDDGGSEVRNYNIYRRDLPTGMLQMIASVDRLTLTYNDTGVSNGELYEFEVRALNDVGEGPASNKVQAQPVAPEENASLTALIVMVVIVFIILILIIIGAVAIMLVFVKRSKGPASQPITEASPADNAFKISNGPSIEEIPPLPNTAQIQQFGPWQGQTTPEQHLGQPRTYQQLQPAQAPRPELQDPAPVQYEIQPLVSTEQAPPQAIEDAPQQGPPFSSPQQEPPAPETVSLEQIPDEQAAEVPPPEIEPPGISEPSGSGEGTPTPSQEN